MISYHRPTCACGMTAGSDFEHKSYDEVERVTGFRAVFPLLPAGTVVWLCPNCQQKLSEALGKIRSLLGIADVIIGGCFGKPIRPEVNLSQLEQATRQETTVNK